MWTACLAVVAASTDKSNGFNSNIDWIAPADLQARGSSSLPFHFLPYTNTLERHRCLDQSGFSTRVCAAGHFPQR